MAMAGRAGGQNTVFSTANEKEESDSPGTFTTSFDLLSIAKMVPAKQRRVSNAVGINEGQAADTSTVGDSFAESLGVHGDWRKLPSTTAKELPNPDTAKPMIFRRVAIPSSRLARHSSNIFASDKTNSTKNKQPVNVGDPGTTAWRSEGFSFFENKNLPSPMEALKALSGREMRTSGSPQKRHPSVIYNLPGSGQPLNQQQQDLKDGWRMDGDTSNHERRVYKDISSRKVMHGVSENTINSNTVFQTGETTPLDSEPSAPTRFTKVSALMAPVKSSSDSAAGILRAAAEPFEPKRVSSPARAITSKIRVESISTESASLKLGSSLGDSDPSARLIPDNFHKGFTSQPAAVSVAPSHGASGQPSIASAHWKLEGSHRSSEPGEQNMKISKDGPSPFGASRDAMRERSSFSDAGISQLWSFPKGENGSQFANNEPPPSLVGSSVVDPSPDARSFAVQKTSSDTAPSPSKLRAGQITVRDEAMEQIVPTPRKSLSSDLQIVERLERKAMVLSKSESEIVTALLEEASINDHIQHSIGMENPVPQMDEHGRRGAISMQGTVIRRPDNKDTGGHRTNNPKLEVQRNQGPVETRKQIREAWLEPAGEVKIRIREEGSSEPADKYWPYPYTRPDVTAREITTQLFVELNEQMVSYVRMGPDGIRQDHNWGRFKSRKGKSGYLPGHEPWFGGDNTSFFDLSFGATSSYNTGKVTIKPPPGLSLTPVVRPMVATEQMKTTQAEPGGLRDLVESSTPDYNHYNDDYKKLRARTLQEWNLTPISGGAPNNPFNSHDILSRQGSNSSSAGQSVYDSARGQIDGSGRGISSARDGGMFGSITFMNGNGWRANGQGDVGSPTAVGNETFEGQARRRRSEQRQFAFGMTGEAGSIVFGGDEGSDGV